MGMLERPDGLTQDTWIEVEMPKNMEDAAAASAPWWIITWQCQWCGWANDNNQGPCRKCGRENEPPRKRPRRRQSTGPMRQT